jgi:hypothetical protein
MGEPRCHGARASGALSALGMVGIRRFYFPKLVSEIKFDPLFYASSRRQRLRFCANSMISQKWRENWNEPPIKGKLLV